MIRQKVEPMMAAICAALAKDTLRSAVARCAFRCGEPSFGEFGLAHRDLTVIGSIVNVASRAQSAAAAGEILVSQCVYERVQSELAGSQA